MRRMAIIIVVFIVGLTLLTMFGIYSPLQKTIQSEKQKNFVTTATIYEESLDAFFKNAHEKANLISGDYYIQNTLKRYKDGELNESEITTIFESGFSASMSNISYLSFAQLGSSETVFASFGNLTEVLEYDYISKNFYDAFYLEIEDNPFVRVIYPIRDGTRTTGYLIMYFSMSHLIKNVLTEDYIVTLSNTKAFNDSVIQKSTLIEVSSESVYLHDSHIDYLGRFDNADVYYDICISSNVLYGAINSGVKYSLILVVVIAIAAFLSLNHTIYKRANHIIKDSKYQKEAIMKIADYDSLTQAYSRNYFDRFVNSFNEMYDEDWTASLVMIDFDNLKMINDQFGHIAGDIVLKTTSALVLDSLRRNDLLFRFGGDEFVLILEDCDLELAKKIVSRIISEITKENETSNYPIAISYGISQLKHDSNIMEVIHEADVKMYKNKSRRSGKNYDLFSVE